MSRQPNACRQDFVKLVQPLLEHAAGYAYSLVGNHADAEDAVQEAVWKGYRGLDRYDQTRSFKGWWFAILRNCCLDLLRNRRTRPRIMPIEQAHVAARQAVNEAEPLGEALAELTSQHREILELRYFGGCSYSDLAEALKIPLGTVMSRLHAARLALAAAYQKD